MGNVLRYITFTGNLSETDIKLRKLYILANIKRGTTEPYIWDVSVVGVISLTNLENIAELNRITKPTELYG